MDKLVITGGKPLKGTIAVSGAKNSALPILFATILSDQPCKLENVPNVVDIQTTLKLLSNLGISCEWNKSLCTIQAKTLTNTEAPYDLVRTMRASVLCLGPILARMGKARVSLPGGCSIGARPVNLHLMALEKMGAEITLESGYIDAKVKKLRGAEITFEKISVGATEHTMMSAVLAEGTTVIHNAALEPEITDLANFLRAMGAKIEGDGTPTITIQGVTQLHGCSHSVIGDRIEAGTYLIAAAGNKNSDVTVTQINPAHIKALLDKLKDTGAIVEVQKQGNAGAVRVIAPSTVQSVDISTQPYPGFPTDMQAQFMALLCLAKGRSVVTENIFENRFMHVAELMRLGAQITIEGKTAVINGSENHLHGATVMATDLRASACLVIAGLAANGTTQIRRIYHLDRGYQKMEEKLKALGAHIHREKESQ